MSNHLVIAIAGVHGIEKTILAKDLASRLGINFLETNISGAPIWERYLKTSIYQLQDRIKIQDGILDYLYQVFESHRGTSFVADRSFTDIAMYLLSAGALTSAYRCQNEFFEFLDDIKSHIPRMFDHIFVLQPSITLTDNINPSYLAESYKEMLNIISIGYHNQLSNEIETPKIHIIPRKFTKLEDRAIFCYTTITGGMY